MSETDDVTLTRQQFDTLLKATKNSWGDYPGGVCQVLADLFGTCHVTYAGGMFRCELRKDHGGVIHLVQSAGRFVRWDDELSDDTTTPPAGDRTHSTNRQEA